MFCPGWRLSVMTVVAVAVLGCRGGAEAISDGGGSAQTRGAGATGGTGGTGGAEANNWAAWPMPNPVSTGLPNPTSYDATRPDLVIDNVTGLTWQRNVDADTFLWNDARAVCENLVLGGTDDWRLPSLIELVSIVDFTREVPALDPTAFPDTTGANFWTVTPLVGSPGEAWYLAFSTGFTYHGHADLLPLQVRCVRQTSPAVPGPQPHYVFPSADTVFDASTKLTWQRAVDPTARSWGDAGLACRSLDLAGTGWRLPSVKELQTLLDLTRQMPALDPIAFPAAPSNEYWTSSPLVGSSTDSWYVSFSFGLVNTLSRDNPSLVRCVR